MIREPSQRQQQTDLIELPTVEVHSSHNSMTTNSLSNVSQTNKNHLNLNQNPNLNTNTNQTQRQNRIPRQTSRPRIFLLTRPAKPSLVRIVTPTVQPHHQKYLNSIPHDRPQSLKGTATSSQESSPKTAIIKIQQPFLPRSPPVNTLSAVKTNLNQVKKKDLIQYPQDQGIQYESLSQQITAQEPQSELKSQDSLVIHQEIIQYPPQVVPPSPVTANKKASELYQSLAKSVKKPITIQENTVQVQYNLAKKKEKKGPLPLQAHLPLTLTSMAGIELTGADMSHTAADMSGAMPPTATVEEINVPVFLDEYLQQAAAISTTAASATTSVTTTTNNITYNNDDYNTNNNLSIINNNSNSNTNNFSNYHGREEDETVVKVKNNINNNNCLETFDNFEFDIDLLTENHSDDDQDKALELQLLQRQQQPQQQELIVQQQNNLDNLVNATEKQTQQLQLMLEDILFNSNNNDNSCSNNNNNKNNNTNNILNNNTTTNNNNTLNNNTTTNNNNNTFKMANGLSDKFDGDIEDLFNVAPNSQVLEEILSPPLNDMDLSNFSPTMENAVDFNQSDNDGLSLMGFDMVNNTSTSYFINSQPNAVMFSTGISTSAASSQNLSTYPSVAALSQEILGAEPHIPPEMIHYPHSSYEAEASSSSNFVVIDDTTQFIDEDGMEYSEMKLETTMNPLKRNSAHTTHKHLQEKRMKLRLDIKRPKEIDTQSQDLDTPAIINSILQNDEFNTFVMSPAENSTDIYNQLINSPHESIVKSEIDTGDYTNDITPPYTPYSVNSSSQQTNFTGIINTAPSSPASSIATTNATSGTTRRGRGRPAKKHSDMPDLSEVHSETDRKKAFERYKNNEASRKSRLKNKQRDIATEQLERELTLLTEELEMELHDLKRIERKLRQALKRQHFGFAP